MFSNPLDVDPEDMNYTPNMSNMAVSEDDADDEVEVAKEDANRKHIVYQCCLLELFTMVCFHILHHYLCVLRVTWWNIIGFVAACNKVAILHCRWNASASSYYAAM